MLLTSGADGDDQEQEDLIKLKERCCRMKPMKARSMCFVVLVL
jgi:hypothetical protein